VDYPWPANAGGTQSKLSLPMPKSEPKSQLKQQSANKKKCNYFDKNDRLLSFCGYWEPIYVPLHSGGREVQGRQTWSIIFCNMYDSAGSFLNFFCHLNWVKEAIQFRKYVLLGKCLDVLK